MRAAKSTLRLARLTGPLPDSSSVCAVWMWQMAMAARQRPSASRAGRRAEQARHHELNLPPSRRGRTGEGI